MQDAFTVVVLTLLQLCHGQTSQPEWFAVNSNNDPGYTPKPITEIFTSDSPYTSKNPALFTQPTTSTTSTQPPTARPAPIAELQNVNAPSQNRGSPVQPSPEIMSQVVENQPDNELPNFLIVFDPRGQVNPNSQLPGVSPPLPTSPLTQATASANIQHTSAIVTPSPSQPRTQMPSTQGTSPTFQPRNEQQMLNSAPPEIQSNQQPIQNNIIPSRWPLFVYPMQFPGFNSNINSTPLPRPQTTAAASTTLAPPPETAKPINSKPLLTVRVKAPKGSITNIRINPSSTVRPTTTRRRKPTTRRIMNYNSCMTSCNGQKLPICSSPVGLNPINPDKLKGFPSMCHMACNNSFKKDLYEKVTDGRCGRLRTRIRPVDKKKLNREELNKAQYTIVHNAPDTVVEFAPARQ